VKIELPKGIILLWARRKKEVHTIEKKEPSRRSSPKWNLSAAEKLAFKQARQGSPARQSYLGEETKH
jgi:hypothetical protein